MAGFRSAMLASAVASAALAAEHAYADGGSFKFLPFSQPSPSAPPASDSARPGPPPPRPAEAPLEEASRVRNDNPRTSAAGFDPEALERGAKALREINSSSQAKKVCSDPIQCFFSETSRVATLLLFAFCVLGVWVDEEARRDKASRVGGK